MMRFINLSLAGLMVLAVALPASATDIFCSVVDAKQGTFDHRQGTRQVLSAVLRSGGDG